MIHFMKRSPILATILAVLVLFLGYCGYLASQPNHDIVFVRNVPSNLNASFLGKSIAELRDWPLWHHMMVSAQLVDQRGQPYSAKDQVLDPQSKGGIILLKIENPNKQWKRFELMAEVLEYQPNRLIRLKLLKDSKEKITKIFDTLEWTIELLPPSEPSRHQSAPQTTIRGTVIAHTDHWRGRVFGGLTPRIIMNQVFYADLVKFATLDKELDLRAHNEAKAAPQTQN
jgi:hypothetical protein